MLRSVVILLVLTTSYQDETLRGEFCILDLAANFPNTPLVVDLNLKFPDPISPDDTRLAVAAGETIYIGCPGGAFNNSMISNGEPAVCNGDTVIWSVNSDQYAFFPELTCVLDPQQRPRLFEQYPRGLCENSGKPVNLGYNIDNNFVSVISTCFDPVNLATVYSKYVTTPWSNQLAGYIPTFSDVYVPTLYNNINLFSIYDNIPEIVESLGLHGYITDDVYLEKVYLATTDDFLTVFEKDATVDLVNTATRWNTFSAGNWKSMDDMMRVRAKAVGDVATLTGTLGVATLLDDTGTPVDLYLSETHIPVPRWFWKLFFSLSEQSGVIMFGFNNPYAAKSDVDTEFNSSICKENIVDQVFWPDDIDNVNPLSGFLYACNLDTTSIIDTLIMDIVQNVVTSTVDGSIQYGVFGAEKKVKNNEDTKGVNQDYFAKLALDKV